MTDVERELRAQFREVFASASYPVEDGLELVPILPDGPSTRFTAGEFSMTAMELAMRLSEHQDFPYDDVDALVDDLIAGLRAKDLL